MLRDRAGCRFFERRTDGAALKAAMSDTGLLLGLLADQQLAERLAPAVSRPRLLHLRRAGGFRAALQLPAAHGHLLSRRPGATGGSKSAMKFPRAKTASRVPPPKSCAT